MPSCLPFAVSFSWGPKSEQFRSSRFLAVAKHGAGRWGPLKLGVVLANPFKPETVQLSFEGIHQDLVLGCQGLRSFSRSRVSSPNKLLIFVFQTKARCWILQASLVHLGQHQPCFLQGPLQVCFSLSVYSLADDLVGFLCTQDISYTEALRSQCLGVRDFWNIQNPL